jgi:hypothetical protein
MVLIRTQLDRFERRFVFWSGREQELNGVRLRQS